MGIPRTYFSLRNNWDIPEILLELSLSDKNYNFVTNDYNYQHGNTSDNVGIPRTIWEYPGQLFRSEMSGVFQPPVLWYRMPKFINQVRIRCLDAKEKIEFFQ